MKYIRLFQSNINPAWHEIQIKLTNMLRKTWFYKTVTKYIILVGTFEGNGHLKDLGVDGGIILKLVL